LLSLANNSFLGGKGWRAPERSWPLPSALAPVSALCPLPSSLDVLLECDPVPDLNLVDHVPLRDLIQELLTGDDPSEDGVLVVEVRLRGERHEELAAAGVAEVEGDADCAADEGRGGELVGHGVAGAAFPIAARVACLHDEVGHDAMDLHPIEE